jgi:xylulose-5-phosphate/fructose-6-phosphate phosphoketolase
MHAYWRASNYLSVGQIYLQDNPLLEFPLRFEHIKPFARALGHDAGIELSLCAP